MQAKLITTRPVCAKGRRKKVFMRCEILKEMPDGLRYKIRVNGNKTTRIVDKEKVIIDEIRTD